MALKYFTAALLLISCSFASSDVSSYPAVLSSIQNELPHHGILKKTGRFVYVDVDDEYIHKLITFIENDGFEKPPYFGNSELVGAHITVIYSDEVEKYGIDEIQECGEKIDFTPKECKIVHPPNWHKIDEVYFVAIESPRLDQIRKKYGLPKSEYEFHITIGVKPKTKAA